MNRHLKKSVSFVLAVIMVISVFATVPFTAFAANDYTINSTTSTDDYYNLISKKDWDIAPGITESEIVLNNDAGDRRQVLYVMEADLNNEYVKVINSYMGMKPEYGDYKVAPMSQQAAYAEANGYGNVVGAMNTTLSWYSGYPTDRVNEPLGFIMVDAEIFFDPGNCGYTYGNVGFPSVLVINKDYDENGNPRPADIPKVEMPQIRSAADLDGWEDQVIPCSSGYIVKNGVNQYTVNHSDAAPRSVVGIKPDGTVVIMLNDGRQSPTSAGMSMYELAEVMLDLGCSFAVNCDGGGSSTYLSQRPGEELKVNNVPSDGAERSTTTGILFISTAPANGEFYKAHISADAEYYTPGSKVQFNAIGTDMGGTEVDIPADAVWQLADSSFGTVEDGLFVSSGKTGDATVQLVYNGEIVGEATITIVLPDIAFRTDTIVLGYGDTMALPVEVTTNEGRNEVTYSDGDIVYTLSDAALGTIDGDMFTACSEEVGLTDGTITAVICGQTDKAVTANIRFGKASEIAYDYEDGVFIVDESLTGNIGGDDAADTGEYIYGWHIVDTRLAGHLSYRFFAKKNYTPVGYDIPAKVYLADSTTGKVKNGNYSMGIDIDWTWVTASCHGQMDIFLPESLDLTDATRVGFWMYVPAEMVTASMQIRATFMKDTGSTTAVTKTITDMMGTNNGVENGGWYYFSWEVLDGYKSLEYFEINSHYTAGEGNYNYYQDLTFYVDDITVDYSDATIDRENPYFTSMTIADEFTNGVEVNGQTITTNTITLMAQAYENTTKTNATGLNRNSVKVYVDGVETTASIAMAPNGTITVSDVYLNDGVHTIVMEVSDNQGNVGNIVRKVVVNTEKSAVRLEVPTTDELLPTGSIYWVNLVADDLASIKSVTTTINLDYVNDWELEGMEVAYGFTAEYYVNAHNDAVITFTRVEGVDVEDTTVLAKLPIRIWMALGWMDDSGIRANYISNDHKMQDKYYILTPHAMWYSDGTRDYRLVVSAEAGLVTYTDGSTMTFSANETVLQTEMNRYYTNVDKQGKWSFHIHTAGEAQNKAATCTEAGYTGRVFCVGCACESVENLGAECDTHNGCGSVIEWGEIIPATGHDYKLVNGVYVCANCGGENGVANGLIKDGDVYRYFIDGVAQTGWIMIDADWYYFNSNAAAQAGKYAVSGIEYEFEETGKLVSGVWAKTLYGTRYFYGPGCYASGWYEIDGNRYFFENTYRYEGYRMIFKAKIRRWYNFGDDGICREDEVINGFYWDADKGLAYVVDSVGVEGLHKIDGDYYFFNYYGYAVSGFTNVGSTHCDMPTGQYYFGEDYKAYTGLVEKNGTTYYYENGRAKCAGLVEVDGALYFAGGAAGEITVNKKVFVWNGNGILPEANYEFGADGKILNGVVEKDGALYFYKNGQPRTAGLIEFEGAYYFAGGANGEITVNKKIFVWQGNGILPEANYEFGADGKMLDGLVEKDGVLYYYENGQPKMAGLIEIDGDYYFAGGAKGEVTVGKKQYVWKANGIALENADCEFGADGKMLNGIVEKDGTLYYYVMGRPKMAGLIEIDGDYYFAGGAKGEITVGKKQYVWKANGIALDNADCEFGADGKMLNGIVDKNGTLYYYVMGRPRMAGLVEVDGALYFAGGAAGEITVGKKTYVWKANGILPEATYEFGADGKMLDGIVEKNGTLYYYSNGQAKMAGLVEYDGAYYFVYGVNGEVTVGKSTFVWDGNGLLPESTYEFGADGKMVNGFVTKADGIYYYENGKPGRVGLNYIDGYYYFVDYSGKLFTNGTYFVWETNGYSIGMSYKFDELGRLILK